MNQLYPLIALYVGIALATAVNAYITHLNRKYTKALRDAYEKDDAVLEYCIAHILQQSIKSEDYETANRCKKILNELKQARNKSIAKDH